MLISFITRTGPHLRITGKSLSVQQDAPEFEWLVVGPESALDLEGVTPIFMPDMDAAIAHTRGKYIWFMDAHACLPDAFAMRDVGRELHSAFLPDFMYGDTREDGHIIRAPDLDRFVFGPVTNFAAMLYAKNAIGDLKFQNPYDFALHFITKTTRHHYMARILCDAVATKFDTLAYADTRRELGIVPNWKNAAIIRANNATQFLKKNAPKLYWFLYDAVQPSERKSISQFRAENPKFQPKPLFGKRKL